MTAIATFSAKTRKFAIAGVAALAFGGAMAVTATPASAGWRHHHHHGWGYGGAAAAGIVGGLALGAMAASAARPASYYGPTYAAGDCYVVRQRVWTEYGWRRVRRTVCD